jgi:lipoyl(octanoyl) transferase
VAYVMLDLKKRQQAPDIKHYIWQLEEWAIRALAAFDVKAERRAGRIGLWVAEAGGEAKIAAVGVRIRRWVTYHGIAINVNPDLSHFAGIVPCGVRDFGVTSLARLQGREIPMAEMDEALQASWGEVFTFSLMSSSAKAEDP